MSHYALKLIAMAMPRHPPHSIEAEQSVLGGLLLNNRAFDELTGQLSPEDFDSLDHRTIYEGISALLTQGKPADFITLGEHLRERNLLERAGGISYLGTLAADTPGTSNIAAYGGIVRERAILREVAAAGQDTAELAFSPAGRSVEEIIDLAEQRVFSIRQRRESGQAGCRHISTLAPEVAARLEELAANQGRLLGVPTGLRKLDELIKGFQPGDLIIVAARPGMGKTALAMGFAEQAAFELGTTTLVFSMEMTSGQIVTRIISSLGRIDQELLRTGALRDQDWAAMVRVVGRMQDAPLFIDDTPALSIVDVRARSRRLARIHPLGLIVVDYLQLMQAPGARENRNLEISEISRGLKALAKELRVPVIALSQLSRAVEARENKRPRMSDLRESGSIEQDADIVMFVYREAYYDNEDDQMDAAKADIIVAKHRNGPTGVVSVAFIGRYTRFDELSAQQTP